MRLDDCVTRAARIWPGRPATWCQGRPRTWRQVREDVRMLAADLRSLGAEPGDRIAVLAENSDRYLDTFFAVSWIGAVIVPLDTRLTDEELAACLSDSGAVLLLSGESTAVRAAALARDVPARRAIYLGATAGLRAAGAGGPVRPRLWAPHPRVGGREDPAAIFYAGGGTGRPKGVLLSHDNLLAGAWHLLPAFGWTEDTAFLHAAPMSDPVGVCCLVAVCVVAGRQAVLPSFDAAAVIDAVDAHDVTALWLTPAMIGALTRSPAPAGRPLPSLTAIVSGGSPLPGELIERVRLALPWARLWQAYGHTEAAPVLTLLRPGQHAPGGKAGSAGLPVPGCEISIRDPASGKELPPGQPGEICGRGDTVMTGYWNRPELTGRVLRWGWLHTGDAGYLDEDGYLHVLGRLDELIVVGGEIVYPARAQG